METRFSLSGNKPNIGPKNLLKAAESAEIHAFGWPIGVVLNREDAAPKPRADGIAAEIVAETTHRSYDYWAHRHAPFKNSPDIVISRRRSATCI